MTRLNKKARQEQLKRTAVSYKGKHLLRAYIEREYMEENGYAVIDVCMYEGLALYDPLSMGRQRELNPEIYEFIDRKANIIPAVIPLKIRFHAQKLTQEEQRDIRLQLSEHYAVQEQDLLWDKRSNRRKMLAMLVLGLAFLSIYFYVGLRMEDALFSEMLSIIGSFALWEAADCFFLERHGIQKELLYTAQHMAQRVEFVIHN